MSEQNKNLIRRAVEEVWNRGNFTVLGELVSPQLTVVRIAIVEPVEAEP